MPLLLLLLALLKPQLSAAYPPTGSIVIALLRKTEAPFRRSTAVHRAPLLTACTELQQMSAGCSRSYLRHQNSSSQPPQPQPHQESNSLTRSHHQLRSKSSRSAGAFLYGEIHIFFTELPLWIAHMKPRRKTPGFLWISTVFQMDNSQWNFRWIPWCFIGTKPYGLLLLFC